MFLKVHKTFNVKIGKIIDIKHNYGSKIYPKNQVILDCFMPSTNVKLHSDMGQ